MPNEAGKWSQRRVPVEDRLNAGGASVILGQSLKKSPIEPVLHSHPPGRKKLNVTLHPYFMQSAHYF